MAKDKPTEHLKVFDEWQLKAMEGGRFGMFAEVMEPQPPIDFKFSAWIVKQGEYGPTIAKFVTQRKDRWEDMLKRGEQQVVEVPVPYAIGDRIVAAEEPDLVAAILEVTDVTAKLAKDVTEEEIVALGFYDMMKDFGATEHFDQLYNTLRATHGPDSMNKWIFLYSVKG